VIVASPNDFNEASRRKLPRFLFDYLDGGAGAEMTLRRNLSDLSSIALRQRVTQLLGMLAKEMRVAMTLIGAADISQIGRDVLDMPQTSTAQPSTSDVPA
jgi:isopentenyl diphosphate isomerase/L-lactate dehydrogenase-like FMN-dependent dehydrogenase